MEMAMGIAQGALNQVLQCNIFEVWEEVLYYSHFRNKILSDEVKCRNCIIASWHSIRTEKIRGNSYLWHHNG